MLGAVGWYGWVVWGWGVATLSGGVGWGGLVGWSGVGVV